MRWKLATTFFCAFLLAIRTWGLDIDALRKDIYQRRERDHRALRRVGIFDREAHRAVDEKYLREARALEAKRVDELRRLCRKAGVELPPRSGGSSRGILGDYDSLNVSRKEVDKLVKAIESHNASVLAERARTGGSAGRLINIEEHRGYVKINDLDVTVFKKFENPDKFVFLRGEGKETALAYRLDGKGANANREVRIVRNGKVVHSTRDAARPVVVDKDIYNLDNIKKIAGDLTAGDISRDALQNVGKGTMRILENTYGKNFERVADPVERRRLSRLLQRCRDLKVYSAETAGLHSADSKKRFLKEARSTVVEAYRCQSGSTERKLRGDLERSYREIEDLKRKLHASKGRDSVLRAEYESRRKFYEAESKALHEYRKLRLAAKRGIVRNGGAEIIAECEGLPVKRRKTSLGGVVFETADGRKLSRSAVEEKIVYKDRRSLTEFKPAKSTEVSERRPTLGGNSKFNSAVSFAESAVGAYQTGKVVESYLPEDMNPATKKGLRLLTTVVTLHPVVQGATQAVVGGGQEGFDKLVEWYKEHPGKEPTRWEMTKIGLRGGNEFAKNMIKGVVAGVTVKPIKDLFDIGYGLGDTIKQRRNAAESEARARAKGKEVSKTYAGKIARMRAYLDQVEKFVRSVAASPASRKSEVDLARRIEADMRRARDCLNDNAQILEHEMRDATSLDERAAAYERCVKALKRVDSAFNKLRASLSKCAVKVVVIDASTGKAVKAFMKVYIACGKYACHRMTESGEGVVFESVPPGTCSINVRAEGYSPSKMFRFTLDPAAKSSRFRQVRVVLVPDGALITMDMLRKALPYARNSYLGKLDAASNSLTSALNATIRLAKQSKNPSAKAIAEMRNSLAVVKEKMRAQVSECERALAALSALLGGKRLSPEAAKAENARELVDAAGRVAPALKQMIAAYRERIKLADALALALVNFKPGREAGEVEPSAKTDSGSVEVPSGLHNWKTPLLKLKSRLRLPGYKIAYHENRGHEELELHKSFEATIGLTHSISFDFIAYSAKFSSRYAEDEQFKAVESDALWKAGLGHVVEKTKKGVIGGIKYWRFVNIRQFNSYNPKTRKRFKAVNGMVVLLLVHKNAVLVVKQRFMGAPVTEPDMMNDVVRQALFLFKE